MVRSTDGTADVTLFAHRGFAGVAPENTLAAARRAARLGADAIECDVVPTADGTPVVFHDRRLDDRGTSRGITDGSGAVDERRTESVTSARVLGTTQQIPTFSAFLDAVPDDLRLNVELKHPGTASVEGAPDDESHREQWRPLVERVVAALDRDPEHVLFSSFSQSALAVVRSVEPRARIAPIAWDLDTALATAESLDTGTIHPSIDGLRSADAPPTDAYTVNAWTARTWQDARDAVLLGADGLIADYPTLLSTPGRRNSARADRA